MAMYEMLSGNVAVALLLFFILFRSLALSLSVYMYRLIWLSNPKVISSDAKWLSIHQPKIEKNHLSFVAD